MIPVAIFQKCGVTSLILSARACRGIQFILPRAMASSYTLRPMNHVQDYSQIYTHPLKVTSLDNLKRKELETTGSSESSVKPAKIIGRMCTHSPIKNLCPNATTQIRKQTYSTEPSSDVSSALERLQRLEDSLRYRGYSTIRIALALAGAIGLAVYIFREPLRDNVVGEVSQVASRSLEDEMIIGKVEEFAKILLKAIGNDDNMQRMAADFIGQVIQREESKQAVKQLLIDVMNDPIMRLQLGQTFQEIIMKAVSDQSTLKALKSALHDILQDDGTKEAVKGLLRDVFSQDEIIASTSEFIQEVIKSESVLNQATSLGKQVTQNVITDPTIQEVTSDTIWQAVKSSVVPRWFRGQDKVAETDIPKDEPWQS